MIRRMIAQIRHNILTVLAYLEVKHRIATVLASISNPQQQHQFPNEQNLQAG